MQSRKKILMMKSIGVFLLWLSCISYAEISQVHISYLSPQQMLVMWVSPITNTTSEVIYGLSSHALDKLVNGTVAHYSFEGYRSGELHHAVLENLKPSTLYYYKVGSFPEWSSTYNFTSGPALGTSNIRFGCIGDVGADHHSRKTFEGLLKLRAEEGLDLIVHAGDLSYANNYKPGGPVWDRYGELLEPLASQTPYVPAVGNHETIDKFLGFRLRYASDVMKKNSNGGDFYWSFKYGFIHTIVLSSQNDYYANSSQYAWLEKDLASIDRRITPWVIATWHMPWYNSNRDHHLDAEKMRVVMEPLFIKYKVDIALEGHVHAYERSHPVENYKVTKGATVHLNVGNGGSPEGLAKHWHSKPVWSALRYAGWGYSRLHFVNNTHAHWLMRSIEDHIKRDEVWITREHK